MAPPRSEWTELSERRICVPEHVVFRALAEETILLNVQSGHYHGLDPVGARFFDVLREARTVAEARDLLAAEYQQPRARIETDLRGFCESLQRLGLVELE